MRLHELKVHSITTLSLTIEIVFGRSTWSSISKFEISHEDCWKETEQCATNEADFRNRANAFNCSKGAYTCMLTSNNILVETCAPIYDISAHASGCPTIVCGSQGVGLSSSSFAYCPSNIDGCPNGRYGTYRTSTLFLYPKCLLRLQDRFCEHDRVAEKGNDTLQVHYPYRTSQGYGTIICLVSILSGISIFLLVGNVICSWYSAWKLCSFVCTTDEKKIPDEKNVPGEKNISMFHEKVLEKYSSLVIKDEEEFRHFKGCNESFQSSTYVPPES